MAFTPRFQTDGKTVSMPCATTQTIVKGDALVDNGSGYLAVAAETTAAPVTHVAMQTITTTANGDECLCVRTTDGVFEADCDAAWAQTDVGTYVSLATKATLDIDDGAAEQLFYVEKGIGTAAAGTKVLGWFAHYTPNS